MNGGLIFGRSPNLVLAAGNAVLAVVVAFQIGGFAPTGFQIGVVEVAFSALVALVANSNTIQMASGKAAAARQAAKPKP